MKRPFRAKLVASFSGSFHVTGPGRAVPLVDRPLQLDEQGRPVIPGSSVRGRIRAHLERLLSAMGKPVCRPPKPDQMCPHAGLNLRSGEEYCLACQIFGSAWHPSPVAFDDLRTADTVQEIPLEHRTQVSISRRLGTAQAERLFFSETAPWGQDGGLTLEGEMTGLLDEQCAGWLLAAIRTVSHLGGDKASGMGAVRLDVRCWQWWDSSGRQWLEEQQQQITQMAANVVGA